MNRGSIFWGTILIIVGFLFILNNFGYFNINFWVILGPVLLILFGFWVIVGSSLPKNGVDKITIPMDHFEKAYVGINYAAGKMRIAGLSGSYNLLEGELSGGFELEKNIKASSINLQLNLKPNFIPIVWIPDGTEWIINLSNSVPLSLDIKTGATDSSIDLSGLRVEKFELITGASSTNLILSSKNGSGYYVIKAGLASVNIRIPAGIAARIRASAGLGAVTVDQSRFPKQHGEYKSIDYDSALAKVDLVVETGLGAIDIH